MATATAVRLSQMKIAIHNSGENGMRNASSGMSVLTFGAANSETPLWKYARVLSEERRKKSI
jgi:hypothetical protein